MRKGETKDFDALAVNTDVPKSIPRQLLETLRLWQPINSKWTIKELFDRIQKSTTEFLKIPMMEMQSDEFYSMYQDADNVELGKYNPLPTDVPSYYIEDAPEQFP